MNETRRKPTTRSCMEGWMDGWKDSWMDGGWMIGCREAWRDALNNGNIPTKQNKKIHNLINVAYKKFPLQSYLWLTFSVAMATSIVSLIDWRRGAWNWYRGFHGKQPSIHETLICFIVFANPSINGRGNARETLYMIETPVLSPYGVVNPEYVVVRRVGCTPQTQQPLVISSGNVPCPWDVHYTCIFITL